MGSCEEVFFLSVCCETSLLELLIHSSHTHTQQNAWSWGSILRCEACKRKKESQWWDLSSHLTTCRRFLKESLKSCLYYILGVSVMWIQWFILQPLILLAAIFSGSCATIRFHLSLQRPLPHRLTRLTLKSRSQRLSHPQQSCLVGKQQ